MFCYDDMDLEYLTEAVFKNGNNISKIFPIINQLIYLDKTPTS